ncbi:EPM2AIP1 [Cordylochernes scorpioides]|uniref:EPM2AIP1 n=1 Tax=Cordylochernes scorpioides TaxID=51811 RepID=A0ABY6LC43_9ARAC|nr:EPM2AIP1 [Cordylochernes scorpioides]
MEKKRKIDSECRKFKDQWNIQYFVIESSNQALCLICNESIAVLKEYNMKRHYETKHSQNYSKYTGIVRTEKFEALKRGLKSQQSLFTKVKTEQKAATRASFRVALEIAKRGKPFTDGEMIKECIIAVVEEMCPEKVNLLKTVSMSANTVARRVENIAENISSQLFDKNGHVEWFSLALDESTDVSDTAQVLIYIRGVYKSYEVHEELLDMYSIHGTTTGTDIFKGVEMAINKKNLRWKNLKCITTDGGKNMSGKDKGVVALVSKAVENDGGSKPLVLHCIIHHQSLCGKCLDMSDVLKPVISTVNFIRSFGLNHRQFRQFIAEIGETDLPYHTAVRWLSCGKVLQRFFELRAVIEIFLNEKHRPLTELQNNAWLWKLAFYVDLTKHVNELNLRLQGENQHLPDLYTNIKSFRMKLILFQSQLRSKCFSHFKTCEIFSHTTETEFPIDFAIETLSDLKINFDTRFSDFDTIANQIKIFQNPFDADIETLAPELQMEMIDLQCSDIIKNKYENSSLLEFYKSLPLTQFDNLHKFARGLFSVFGLTALHECSKFGHVDTARILIEAGAEVNRKDYSSSTPLDLAIFDEHVEMVKLLLESGAHVNITGQWGTTPLYLSCFNGPNRKITNILIEYGADVNQRIMEKSMTILHFINEINDAHILIRNGALIDIQDSIGYTPLHRAVLKGNIKMVMFLLSKGADPNIKNIYNSFPLHSAIRFYNLKAAELLISGGTDLFNKLNGLSFLNQAIDYHDIDMAKLIIKHMVVKRPSHLKPEIFANEPTLSKFWDDCQVEVVYMDKTVIGQSTITYRKFVLESCENKLALYLSHKTTKGLNKSSTIGRKKKQFDTIKFYFDMGACMVQKKKHFPFGDTHFRIKTLDYFCEIITCDPSTIVTIIAQFSKKQPNIVNISRTELTEDETKFLSKGLKHRNMRTRDNLKIIAGLEASINGLNHQEKAKIRNIVTITLSKTPNCPKSNPANRTIARRLRDKREIVITRSDKGAQTVIMDTTEYIEKMHTTLNDLRYYEPASELEKKIEIYNRFKKEIRNLQRQRTITEEELKNFISKMNTEAYIYGLPKLHKPGIPLRTIVAYYLSPAAPLAKFLNSFLTPILRNSNNHTTINSIPTFIQEIWHTPYKDNHTMVSFDVVNLYPSLPHPLIIESTKNLLSQHGIDNSTSDKITKLINLSLKINIFTFNSKYYKQTNGSPMGRLPKVTAIDRVVCIDRWKYHTADNRVA